MTANISPESCATVRELKFSDSRGGRGGRVLGVLGPEVNVVECLPDEANALS